MKLALVAGHGVNDSGAIAHDGTKEATLTQQLRDSLFGVLSSQFLSPRDRYFASSGSTMADDDAFSLREVRHWADMHLSSDDLLIDIHFNANMPGASGTEVFVHDGTSPANRQHASHICELVSSTLGIPNRGVKSEKQSARNILYILHAKPRVILLEVCFLNQGDLGAYRKNKDTLVTELGKYLFNITQ